MKYKIGFGETFSTGPLLGFSYYEADDEFEEKVNGKDQNDLNIIKFDPKKHRKH